MKQRKRLIPLLLAVLLAAALLLGPAATVYAAGDSEYELDLADTDPDETEAVDAGDIPAPEVPAEEAAAEVVPDEEAAAEEVPAQEPSSEETELQAETPMTPYVIDHVNWKGSILQWEDPEPMPNAVYMISFVYSYISVNDLETSNIMDGEVYPDFDGEVWYYDFSQVVNKLPDANMGQLSYVISVFETDPELATRSNPTAYQGDIRVHLVLDPVWETVDANGPISENGGTITRSGTGMFFDGEPIDLYVQENDGYRLSLLAHKKGSMTSFSLDENDDMLYLVTGRFTKTAKITLEAGNEAAAANIAGHHTPSWDGQNMFVYDGGTTLTYYVPWGADRGSFYYDNILHDCLEIPTKFVTQYRGIAPRPMEAYASQAEVDADMNGLSPVVTEDGTYYILWARPAGACEINIEPIAPGTKVTSRKEGGVTIQDPAPQITVSGNVELYTESLGSGAVWVDESFSEELNGAAGSDGTNVVFGIQPKFGYYFDGSTAMTVNGQSLVWAMNLGSVIIGYARVAAPGSAGSVFGSGAGTLAASLASAAVGLGGGFLLGKKKKKTEE